jgi:nucleotide-binding universal stress UspA family protein
MTIKHILVHVEPGTVSERRLKCALSLAESFGAKVTGLTVMPSPTATAFAMMGDAQVYAAAAQAAEESCVAARKLFEALTAGSAVETEWREGNGIPVDVITAESGCADLVILGRDDGGDPDGAFYPVAPADVILACGRPVLVLPNQPPPDFRAKRILLAWKSAPEAARAAHDALPLLVRAEEVILTEIVSKRPPSKYEVSTDAMVEHLRMHGVPVTVRRIAQAGEPGDLLIQVAGESNCDLIVAGGYGHNRLREWVLGGVTYSLLHASPLPCLLSH